MTRAVGVLFAIHSTYFFVMALVLFGLAIVQVLRVSVEAAARGENGWRAAFQEVGTGRIAVCIAFGLITLAKSQLR